MKATIFVLENKTKQNAKLKKKIRLLTFHALLPLLAEDLVLYLQVPDCSCQNLLENFP